MVSEWSECVARMRSSTWNEVGAVNARRDGERRADVATRAPGCAIAERVECLMP